ncbi:MAG: hypothetical protein ACI8X5_002699 [Planctomycetota bacterium]|jgi:hypothetical protein
MGMQGLELEQMAITGHERAGQRLPGSIAPPTGRPGRDCIDAARCVGLTSQKSSICPFLQSC